MEWHELARRQGGVIDRGQFASAGLSERRLQGLIARRELTEVFAGTYVHRSNSPGTLQQMWAAALWSDGGVISHGSAAAVWKLPGIQPRKVHVTVADRRYRAPESAIRVHRVPLPAKDRSELSGLPVTSRVRTIVDILRTQRVPQSRSLLDRSIQLGWVSADDLSRSLRDGPGRHGNSRLRELLAGLEPGADAESERVLHRLLQHAGITGWRRQFMVRLRHRTAYLDVAFPQLKLGIEVDGKLAHDELSDRFEDDRSRQNELVAAGWTILRFTWRQLHDRPDWVLAQVVQFLPA